MLMAIGQRLYVAGQCQEADKVLFITNVDGLAHGGQIG